MDELEWKLSKLQFDIIIMQMFRKIKSFRKQINNDIYIFGFDSLFLP